MLEADITKVVEEMAVRIRETEEDFIFDTIRPYCQETLRRKINKAELKQIILRGSRQKGKWIQTKDDCDGVNFYDFSFECSKCGKEQSFKSNYCSNCGAYMREGEKDERI